MKSLFALLLLGIALGIGFWKTQNPDTPFSELPNSALGGVAKLKGAVATLTGGAAVTDSSASVSQTNAAVPSVVKILNEDLNTTNERVAALEEQLEMLNGRINAQSEQFNVERINSSLDELTSALPELKENQSKNYNEQNAIISELSEKVSALDGRLNGLPKNDVSQSASIDDQQSEVRMQLALLQEQLNAGDDTDIMALTESLQQSRDRIQVLEQQVVNLPESSNEASDANEAQTALLSQVQSLEMKLATVLENSDPSLASTLNEVEKQVSELAAKSYVTQEELRSQKPGKSIEYKIYFDINSTAVSADAAKVLNSFIAQEKNRTTGVSIFGFTDRKGSAAYNQKLALERATNVRTYLIQNGFSFSKINSISGLGEIAAEDLEDGAVDAQQRSVVLTAQQP